MIQQYLGISPDKLIKAGWETLYMVGFSLIIGSIVGFLIAIVLWLTRKGGLKENSLLYTILNGFINIIRSTPFIILLVCVMPFTKIIVGTRIGTRAAIVPLVIYTAPFLARLLETSLLEVGGGIIEAAQSMGATTFQIIVHFVLPEAFASVILALTTPSPSSEQLRWLATSEAAASEILP